MKSLTKLALIACLGLTVVGCKPAAEKKAAAEADSRGDVGNTRVDEGNTRGDVGNTRVDEGNTRGDVGNTRTDEGNTRSGDSTK